MNGGKLISEEDVNKRIRRITKPTVPDLYDPFVLVRTSDNIY